jgi:signal peptidase I
MIFNWFKSRTAREADEMRKHVEKMLAAQRDILSPEAIGTMEAALRDLQGAVLAGAPDEELKKQMENVEKAANKSLKPYPNASIRENVEVLLVALAVAMAIRTFFLQPFKIPTGSMQPTLFGVTPGTGGPGTGNQPDVKVPGFLSRIWQDCVYGISYYDIAAPEDGELQRVYPPRKLLIFNLWQDYEFNNKRYTIWFPSDDVFLRAGYGVDPYGGMVTYSPHLKAGDPLLHLKVVAGDHLFVDRVTYNFRHPRRGEIIVFETRGIQMLPQDQFYIKRMVAMGGEKVRIGNDRHLVIDGKRLDNTTPHFEKVYSFDPNQPPQESKYSGHLNQAVAEHYGFRYPIAPLFPDESAEVDVRPYHYMVMGDNTCNSFDSRAWGDFSRTNVIGKYCLVYWPFSSRFGMSAK